MSTLRTSNPRRNIARIGLPLLALSLVACAERPDTSVRPLVDLEGYEYSIISTDNEALQARLETLVDEITPLTEVLSDWSEVTTDLVNPEVSDITFFRGDREIVVFGGGGDAVSSVASSPDWVIFSMTAGETGACWGIRFSGDLGNPTVEYGNMFSPGCAADDLAENGQWHETWPEAAPPPEDGVITFGEPIVP